jgi:hypothetical protein
VRPPGRRAESRTLECCVALSVEVSIGIAKFVAGAAAIADPVAVPEPPADRPVE